MRENDIKTVPDESHFNFEISIHVMQEASK